MNETPPAAAVCGIEMKEPALELDPDAVFDPDVDAVVEVDDIFKALLKLYYGQV